MSSLFALGANSYTAGTKKICCFEAADSSTATLPTVFLAPTTNELGSAGFYDVIGGAFRGEAQTNPSTALGGYGIFGMPVLVLRCLTGNGTILPRKD